MLLVAGQSLHDIPENVKYMTISIHFDEMTEDGNTIITEDDISDVLAQRIDLQNLFRNRRMHIPCLLLLSLLYTAKGVEDAECVEGGVATSEGIEGDIVKLSCRMPINDIDSISLKNNTKFKQTISFENNFIQKPNRFYSIEDCHSGKMTSSCYNSHDRLAFRMFYSSSLKEFANDDYRLAHWKNYPNIDYNINDISVSSILIDDVPFDYFTFEWYGKTIFVISFITNVVNGVRGDIVNDINDLSDLLVSGDYSFYEFKKVIESDYNTYLPSINIDIIYPPNFKGYVKHINIFEAVPPIG